MKPFIRIKVFSWLRFLVDMKNHTNLWKSCQLIFFFYKIIYFLFKYYYILCITIAILVKMTDVVALV